MARPSKLTEEMVAKAKAYETKDAIPTIEDLAIYLDVNRSSIYEWRGGDTELHQQFSDIVDGILALQAKTLINKGLRGAFNPTITKLILSGKHGYVEKSEVDQNVNGNVTFLNDVPRPKDANS